MEALTAAIDELESAFERKDVESVDPSRLRSLLKAVGGLKLTEDGATALKRLGLRVWNACVRLTQAHAPCTLANVKVCTHFDTSYESINDLAVASCSM